MKLIPNWQNKNLKCHYCGTTKSVKYAVSNYGAVVCACNRCVLKYTNQSIKEREGIG